MPPGSALHVDRQELYEGISQAQLPGLRCEPSQHQQPHTSYVIYGEFGAELPAPSQRTPCPEHLLHAPLQRFGFLVPLQTEVIVSTLGRNCLCPWTKCAGSWSSSQCP